MPRVEHVPTFVGAVTLVAGGALVATPATFTRPVGLEDQDLAVRAVGLADLVLVPGLFGGRPRWPGMAGRAALNLAQAAYFDAVAPRAKKSRLVRGAAATLVGLSVVDASSALMLRRAGRGSTRQ